MPGHPWLDYLAKFRKAHPSMKKGVLKAAAKSYKHLLVPKKQRGGMREEDDTPVSWELYGKKPKK